MMTGDPVIDVNIDSGSFGPAHSEADYPLDRRTVMSGKLRSTNSGGAQKYGLNHEEERETIRFRSVDNCYVREGNKLQEV